MKLLAADTSTGRLNVCLAEDGNVRVEMSLTPGRTHAKTIMPVIDSVLASAGWELDMIDGLAVTLGPGSFTGIRIGVSTVKGLASALNKPVAGVSSLGALAYQSVFSPHLVCSAMDARKKEVYYCLYRRQGNMPAPVMAEAVGPIRQALADIDEPCLFIGSGARIYRDQIVRQLGEQAIFPPLREHVIRPSTVARLGFLNFKKNQAVYAGKILPVYIRPPDAVVKKAQFVNSIVV